MTMPPGPANIDYISIIADLNAWGIRDYKIELCCGFGKSYIAQIKCGDVKQMSYPRANRLYAFWYDEHMARVPREPSQTRNDTETST